MADGDQGRKRIRLSAAELRQRLEELMLRRTKLTEEEVALLGQVFPVLFDMYRHDVQRYLKRGGLNKADVKDGTQDVFLSLLRQIKEEGFPEKSLRAKLYWLSQGVSSHYKRGQGRDPVSIGLPSSSSEPPRTPPDLDRGMDFRWLAPQLLSRLTDHQRQVVELAVLDELADAEVAEVLDIPLGTVKSRLRYAKRQMLELIEQLLPPSERRTG